MSAPTAEAGMEWTVVLGASLSAVATAWGVTMRARYRHMSTVVIVKAWNPDNGFDLPAAIAALEPRQTTFRRTTNPPSP